MKQYIILMIAICLLVAPVISAAPDYTFKFGEDAKLIASCDINGVPCTPALASCNLTLRKDMDNSYVVNFKPMTVSFGGDINYTVNNNDLEIGDYSGKINCIQSGENKTATFTAQINPTGDARGYGLFLVLAFGSLLLLAGGILLKNEYVGFISGTLFIVTGIYSMIYGIGGLADLYTRAIAFVCIGLGFIFAIAAGYKIVEGILEESNSAF